MKDYNKLYSLTDDEITPNIDCPSSDDESITDYTDTLYETIPFNTDVENAVNQMRLLLDYGYQQGEPIIFYTSGLAHYETDNPFGKEISEYWNEELVSLMGMGGQENSCQMKIVRNGGQDYTLWIETMIDDEMIEENPFWEIHSQEEVDEVLRIYYYTCRVYDCYEKTIFGPDLI